MKYMLIMRATDEAYAAWATPIRRDAGDDGAVQRRADPGRRAARRRGARRPRRERGGRPLLASRRWSPTARTARPRSCSAASTSSTWPPRRRRSSGPSGCPAGKGFKTEIRRVAHDRRVPAGQRVGPEGAGVARGHRPALSRTRPIGPTGRRPSPPCGGSSRPGSSARWPATPATSPSPRTSRRRRWPRRW